VTGWQLPPPRIPPRLSPLKSSIPNHLSSNRTASSSSDALTPTIFVSPTKRRQTQSQSQTTSEQEQHALRGNDAHGGWTLLSGLSSLENFTQPSKFEREFVEIGELGSGEFGKVMKVRRQKSVSISGTSGDITAVKKSKRFEGVRHR